MRQHTTNKTADKKWVEAAKDILHHCGYYVGHLWHVNDIHLLCEQKQLPRMSDAEAMEVFAIVRDQFDGEQGICWPALERAVQVYYERQTLLRGCYEGQTA